MRKADEILYDANGIGDAIRMAQTEAWNEAIKAAAENANLAEINAEDGSWYYDKESILKLLK